MLKIKITIVFYVIFCSVFSYGQSFIADKIVGVVGKSPILYSEVEEQYFQFRSQGQKPDKCVIFEDLLAQKLLVTQAAIDSIEVTEAEVELELERRVSFYINNYFGTEEKLVENFGKSVFEIKDDMRDMVREQNLMQKMQQEIVKDINITPNEVKEFYKKIDKDSIPVIESEIQISQIVFYPESDNENVYKVKEKLLELRQRVLNGDSFKALAVLYSQGPSSSKGGELGWLGKSDLDPAYAKAAFALKKGQVSKIVESSFGYHLIQLIDKSENRINTRHILMKPEVSIEAKQKAKMKLDSIAKKIRLDSISFKKAAMFYSQDKDTRLNGGMRVHPANLNTKFKVDEFSTTEYYVIRKLKIGEISDPFESIDDKGKAVIKIIKLVSKSEPHKANLEEDFDLLKNMAVQDKQSKTLNEWIAERTNTVYFRIEPPYDNCEFRNSNWKK